jgi:hypothetical protein
MLVTEGLDHEEIKKRIKSALKSIPFDTTLDLHPPMHPDDSFTEIVSAPTLPLPLFPLGLLGFLSIAYPQGSGDCRGISAWSLTSTHPFLRM